MIDASGGWPVKGLDVPYRSRIKQVFYNINPQKEDIMRDYN